MMLWVEWNRIPAKGKTFVWIHVRLEISKTPVRSRSTIIVTADFYSTLYDNIFYDSTMSKCLIMNTQ